jgi:hypothetical protein
MALMGRSANGWVEWKNPQGKTLDEVKQQYWGLSADIRYVIRSFLSLANLI